MSTKAYILMYRSYSNDRLQNCKVVSVHATMKSALLVLDALKYGYTNNFDDVQVDKNNELKIYVTSDTKEIEYEIEIHEFI